MNLARAIEDIQDPEWHEDFKKIQNSEDPNSRAERRNQEDSRVRAKRKTTESTLLSSKTRATHVSARRRGVSTVIQNSGMKRNTDNSIL